MTYAARLVHVLDAAFGGLLDAALPQTCAACGDWIAGGGLACDACHAAIEAERARPSCPRCGRTMPREAIHGDGCAGCKVERFWNVAGVARVGRYHGPLGALLRTLKYGGRERNAAYLAVHLAEAIRAQPWGGQIDALVPVPMHWIRRWQCPCEHASVLTEALARRLKLPTLRIVRRARHGPSQTGMSSRAARFENVKNCFVPPRWERGRVRGRTLCIVDNLLSSGATVYEMSKVLRRAGARRIYAAVVSRPAAPGDPPMK